MCVKFHRILGLQIFPGSSLGWSPSSVGIPTSRHRASLVGEHRRLERWPSSSYSNFTSNFTGTSPNQIWRFVAGKIIELNRQCSTAMFNYQGAISVYEEYESDFKSFHLAKLDDESFHPGPADPALFSKLPNKNHQIFQNATVLHLLEDLDVESCGGVFFFFCGNDIA